MLFTLKISKVGCAFPMVVVSILHREDASHFIFLCILPDGTIGEVVTGDGSCLVLKKTIFDIISRFILSLDVGYYRSLKKEILDLGIRSIFSTSIHRPLFYLVKIQYLTLLSRLCLIWIMNIEHMVAVDSSEYGHLIFKYYFFNFSRLALTPSCYSKDSELKKLSLKNKLISTFRFNQLLDHTIIFYWN